MNLENTKVYTTDPEVIRKYAELCGKELSNGLSLLKGDSAIGASNQGKQFSDNAFVTTFGASAICHLSPKFKKITPDQINALYDEKLGRVETPDSSEWDGEGLPPAGAECEFLCEGFWGDSEYHWCRFLGLLTDKSYAIEFHHYTSPDKVTCGCFDPQCTSFRKPETPEQREERERLEAAIELTHAYWGVKTDSKPSDELLKAMLRIVDKTDYRKPR